MLAVFQQLVGINVIFYYGATLWQLAGFTEDDCADTNIVSGRSRSRPASSPSSSIDKIGRKPLLLIGSAGMAVTLFVMVYAFSHGSIDAAGTSAAVGAQSAWIAVVARQPLRDLLQPQLGPGHVGHARRDVPEPDPRLGAGGCGFAQWFANYLIAQSFPVMAAKLGLTPTYTFYAVSAVISFFLVKRFIHETKGKELEAMEG